MQSLNFIPPATLSLLILAYYLRHTHPLRKVSRMLYYSETEPEAVRSPPGSHWFMAVVVVGILAVLVPVIMVSAPASWLYRRAMD